MKPHNVLWYKSSTHANLKAKGFSKSETFCATKGAEQPLKVRSERRVAVNLETTYKSHSEADWRHQFFFECSHTKLLPNLNLLTLQRLHATSLLPILNSKVNLYSSNELGKLAPSISPKDIGLRKAIEAFSAQITISTPFPETDDKTITLILFFRFILDSQACHPVLHRKTNERIIHNNVTTEVLNFKNSYYTLLLKIDFL